MRKITLGLSSTDILSLQEYDVSEYPQRVGRQKHLLDIDIHFADSRRGTRGRGRGGPRGGRGGPRAGPSRNPAAATTATAVGSRMGGNDSRGPGVSLFNCSLSIIYYNFDFNAS